MLANDVLLCESIVRICLVVFNDKLDSMILVIWEYSAEKLSLIATGAVLSSAIQIDPVNIKQINATKIHDAAMSQMNCGAAAEDMLLL